MLPSVELRSVRQATLATFAHDASIYESTRAYQHILTPEGYTSDEFNVFLHNMGDTTLSLVAARQNKLDEFEHYRSDVLSLINDIERQRAEQGNSSVRNRADWLGSGGFAQVFALETGERRVAVRRTALAPTFDYCIATTLRAAGTPQTEQLLAASYDASVTISAFVEGTPLHKLASEQLNDIVPEHIESLVATAHQLGRRQVTVDANAGNFIYDHDTGFTIIDFRPQNLARVSPSVKDVNVIDIIDMLKGPDVAASTLANRVQAVYEQMNE